MDVSVGNYTFYDSKIILAVFDLLFASFIIMNTHFSHLYS